VFCSPGETVKQILFTAVAISMCPNQREPPWIEGTVCKSSCGQRDPVK